MKHREGCPITYLDRLSQEERHMYYCTCWWKGGRLTRQASLRLAAMHRGIPPGRLPPA